MQLFTFVGAATGASPNSPSPLGAGLSTLEYETESNIALRVMLLLLDELFDLRSRTSANRWLRTRIVALVKQVINSFFGDVVNKYVRTRSLSDLLAVESLLLEILFLFRKIIDLAESLISPSRIAHYLRKLRYILVRICVLLLVHITIGVA